MNLKNPIGIFLISLLVVSCSVAFEEKNIGDQISIALPSYMDELDLGIPEALLQYGNSNEELYIAILKENPKNLEVKGITNIESYSDMYISGIEQTVTNAIISQVSNGIEVQNGMQTITYEVDGIVPENGLGIYYLIKFYKSKTAYYYVSNWTMSNFKDDHISDMKRITNSIKEL
ncbi:MAG: hypothetical protein P8I55_15960 [Crocinitomix sp.]|nr:hypothetical protein [Crocinitomix sp.]